MIEFARNVLKFKNADTTEQNKKTPYPVISLLEEQRQVKNLGGTMRLGAYTCRLKKGSKASGSYRTAVVKERHRHRYEFNNAFRKQFQKAGLIISGVEPKRNLVEIVELKDHPWFIACQFHPEFKSRPTNAHPLFRDFINASIEKGIS